MLHYYLGKRGDSMSEEDYWWDIANATKMGEYLTRKERELINSFLENSNISTCLDVACGSGRFSIPISQHGINIVAVDYDLVPLRKLKDKTRGGGEKIMIIRGDMAKLPFKESSFDCIVSVQTVDHLDVKNLVGECNKLLRKRGFLLFTMSNKHSYKKYIHRILSSYRTFYRYPFDEIMSYLEEEGFEVLKCTGYSWIPFKRNSNSILIGFFEFLENILRLSHFPAISPAVFFIANKKGR